MSAKRVQVLITFQAWAPADPLEGDQWADDIGDAIVAALDGSAELARLRVATGSFSVDDWTDEPVEP